MWQYAPCTMQPTPWLQSAGGPDERAYSSTRICVQELQQFIGAGAAADLPHVYARTLLFAPHTPDEPTPPHELVRKLHSWCALASGRAPITLVRDQTCNQRKYNRQRGRALAQKQRRLCAAQRSAVLA